MTRATRDARAFQEWAEGWARICLGALKPGGHLVAFGGTRTFHRLACALEDAGFEIRDCLMWVYGSGTPKSLDVSKAIDSRKDWRALRELQGQVRTAREALGISQSEAARRMSLIGPDERLGGGGFMWFETGLRIPTREQYPELKRALGLDDSCDEAFEAAEREVVETRRDTGGSPYIRPGRGDGHTFDVTAPATEAAKAWEGWGTALKPGWEPIVLARRPLEGTVAQNVLTYGTGALNIDGCRVGSTVETWPATRSYKIGRRGVPARDEIGQTQATGPAPKGRWPANVLHDGSEEVEAMFPESKSSGGVDTSGHSGKIRMGRTSGQGAHAGGLGDSGSAARFFYSAKASGADRGTVTKGALPLFDIPEEVVRNEHPTVKPVDLMRYLVRLVTPPGGTVLDPFAGSGSTLLAAKREGLRSIGIEMDESYLATAARRLEEDRG